MSGRRAVLAAVAACACSAGPGTTSTSQPAAAPGPQVCMAVSVDWEGAFLDHADLAALAALAARGVPLTHFLNAAYFTHADADADAAAARIRRAIGPADQLGLHIHGWQSLVEAAGVGFRDGPVFIGPDPHDPLEIDGELGFDVVIEAYTVDEMRAIVATSRRLLAAAGFELSPAFRAAGWLAGERVLEAIRREGFTVDSSATDASWLDELAHARLPGLVREYWPASSATTQPEWIATAAGEILEMPDTGSLADYATVAEMVAHAETAVAAARSAPDAPVFAQIGLHQEGAAEFAPRVAEAVDAIAREHGDAIVFATLAGCAERYRAARERGLP